MRALFSLFLCLAIAFQGIAYAHAFQKPCSMNEGKPSVEVAHSASAGDCWNDTDTAAKTGKPCKTGQACSPSGTFVVASFRVAAVTLAASAPVLTGVPFMPSSDPSSIWRPPTLS